MLNVLHAVLPGNQTLDVDVQLTPDGHDGFIVLLIPVRQSENQCISVHCQLLCDLCACVFLSYFCARLMLRGFGGGMIRHTDGISISSPPGPVTCHLLRCVLSFRMPSFPFRMPFCNTHTVFQWFIWFCRNIRNTCTVRSHTKPGFLLLENLVLALNDT